MTATAAPPPPAPLLEVEGITKAYPGVLANSDIAFAIRPGAVHALLGENGAGKSTLVKIVYGLVRPDAGRMRLLGAPYAPASPAAARAAGVAMVFQHFSLFEALTVAENVALGMERPPPLRRLAGRIRAVSAAYGLPLDPDRPVADLSAGERQRVEIVRCLLQEPRLLIMDEPTSVLTPQEVEILFGTLRRIAADGTAILYISHKLEEIILLCESATILRGGRVVAGCDPRRRSARELAELMVGRIVQPPARAAAPAGAPVLEVAGLSLPAAWPHGRALHDVRLAVRGGEILGIGGVAGNGQDELLAALSGERPGPAAAVRLDGRPIGALAPAARRMAGLATAPEERLGHAAAPDMTLTENTLLTAAGRERLVRHGLVGWRRAQGFAARIIAAFDVRTPGTEVAARALSGGNLQKFVIGREILQRPRALVVNQPTWGVDAAAAAAIRQALADLAGAGAAVVVISQDLDELMELAHRFAALNEGRLTPARPVEGLTVREIGLMLGGAHGMQAARPAAEGVPA
ncbi:MAG: ABC transporter ATP-binding protein [Rhodobacteraceae bacterium]|nr:ABC transporter ATP-binding protein [Paracoccaceae bacterium]